MHATRFANDNRTSGVAGSRIDSLHESVLVLAEGGIKAPTASPATTASPWECPRCGRRDGLEAMFTVRAAAPLGPYNDRPWPDLLAALELVPGRTYEDMVFNCRVCNGADVRPVHALGLDGEPHA